MPDSVFLGRGDVVGPTSATDSNIAVFNGTTGKIIKDGGASIPASGIFPARTPQIVNPLTGDTVTATGGANAWLMINPAGVLATLTIKWPASPTNGDEFAISATIAGTTASTTVVTTLTTDGNGNAVVVPLTALTNGQVLRWRFFSATSQWVRIV